MRQVPSEKKARILYVRLTPAQFKKLEANEKASGQTRSIIIRDLVDKHLPTPAPTHAGTSEQLERQLAI